MAPDKTGNAPRAWQRMLSGRRLDLLDPSPLDVEIADIAHGLARVARWNGQTVGDHAFSVAQHSIVVEEIACRMVEGLEPKWRMAMLLHDAPEYVIGDMISPLKTVMGGDYKTLEARLQEAIHRRFSLPPKLPVKIKKLAKHADIVSAYYEAVELAGFDEQEAARIFGRPRGFTPLGLKPWPAAEAQTRFLDRFEELERAIANA
ncbi:HD family hydrolase [Breoghania sp.]|uniref:HD family hydrolase n=1 Tax=Breoghania sp. TaxID=2065378 RepID=UPI00263A35EC|nr:HD family hydrolase [Breoghania sp.]MDJ0932392.1 HD family hydrolase [Breoghania sp.]